MKKENLESKQKPSRLRRILLITGSIAIPAILFHGWLLITSPYAEISVVQQPYKTYTEDNQVKLDKQYDLNVLSNPVANFLGYYKSGILIIQSVLRPSLLTDTKTEKEVLDEIHELRFDPEKPYLISGNQFSVLYPRNLGVFYNSLLDPKIAETPEEWQKRQEIYLLSAMYALDSYSTDKKITTTIVPIGRKSVTLTNVHPGQQPSDALYGMLYAFDKLAQESDPNSKYQIQTTETAKEIISNRQKDLEDLLEIYLETVQDPKTKLVKRDVKLSAARDGVNRDSSFFDNVVMWETINLAVKLGITEKYNDEYTANLREKIILEYWDEELGIFSDEFRDKSDSTSSFSADWLITIPTGFLSTKNSEDLRKIVKIIDYTQNNDLDQPLPIKYSDHKLSQKAPMWVRWAAPNYGGNAIWSYWGAEYLTLLGSVYKETGNERYLLKEFQGIEAYRDRIERYGGFPETFNPDGTFFETALYESIVETGWVVQYERAVVEYRELTKDKPTFKLPEQ